MGSSRNPRWIRTHRSQQAEKSGPPSEWVIDIHNCLREGIKCDLGRSWTIYRVPRSMREVYRKAYLPKLISIGPFHHGERHLRAMEEHKMRYLLRMLGYEFDRGKDQQEGEESEIHHLGIVRQLEELEAAVRGLEQRARQCYSEFLGIETDEFVRIMVVDGCFVIELLRLYHKFDREEDVDDPIFTTRWMLRTLQRDLLMLENQLPFLILQELFNLTSTTKEPSLIDLVLTFFDPLLPRDADIPKLDPKEQYDHMLDVFRSSFLTSVKGKVTSFGWQQLQSPNNISLVQERQLIHCIEELQEAGVKVKKRDGFDLLDISFCGRVLEIPPLYIDDNTVPLFLNFVAYEQCDEESEPFFTNFFMFFDSLINSPTDVDILHKCGIIKHVLGTNKDVARLVNNLCREIVYDMDECYLSNQMKEINDYCERYYRNRWHVWWANLVNEYFSSPWTLISLLAAISLLVLTALQTFYTVYPYYKPS
ncbi:UPF0481 protein At3g47200-like [Punica granatum]|uniref:Uncharacterized protein n=2 Tax=Punica granatum TaxID=22663 RepID=A0A218XNQ9_PUNGR|nr:UPF0481 protein At3g47200-like [Punica granatum]OWM85922.1 hypothetical protein CDL15_Pgr012172 [Punica granatum]PKI78822.1 hypothetical protein CRG98_000782 [Punica granatum]